MTEPAGQLFVLKTGCAASPRCKGCTLRAEDLFTRRAEGFSIDRIRRAVELHRCTYEGALDGDEASVYVTGVPAGNEAEWRKLAPGDVIFVGADRPHNPIPARLQLTHVGLTRAKLESESMSTDLWGSDEYKFVVVVDPLVPLQHIIDLDALARCGFGYKSAQFFSNHLLTRPSNQWALRDAAMRARLLQGVAQLPRTAPPSDEASPPSVARLADAALASPAPEDHLENGGNATDIADSMADGEEAEQPEATRRKRPRPPSRHAASSTVPSAESVEIESDHLDGEAFEVAASAARAARRPEARMVHAFAARLRQRGHTITARRYHCGGLAPLRCDLLDETDGVLYEAKSAPERREDVQKGIGQLFTYRHAEQASGASGIHNLKIAMLLPRFPDELMVATLAHAGVKLVVFEEVTSEGADAA